MCCGFVSAKGGKTAKLCCRRSCANCCAATGDPRSPPIGYFLARWNFVLSRQQRKALRDIRDCRTAVLGGHLYECDRCGHQVKVFNSCRNRNCPKCQATARAKWLADREAELLPVPYFHVTFT